MGEVRRRIVWTVTVALMASVSLQARPQRGRGQETAPQQPAPGGLSCFENLAAPEYTPAALQAHVEGSVWTTTHVNAQGTIEKIDTQVVSAWDNLAPKLLTPPAEKAIRAAKIKPECYGKPVLVVFRYELHGDVTPTPQTTSRMDPPNVVWIDSQAETAPKSAMHNLATKPSR
jgi:hypothetical protein